VHAGGCVMSIDGAIGFAFGLGCFILGCLRRSLVPLFRDGYACSDVFHCPRIVLYLLVSAVNHRDLEDRRWRGILPEHMGGSAFSALKATIHNQ